MGGAAERETKQSYWWCGKTCLESEDEELGQRQKLVFAVFKYCHKGQKILDMTWKQVVATTLYM